MTDKRALEALYSKLIDHVSTRLEPSGFRKRGRSLRRLSDEGVEIIEFQKSTGSSPTEIVFTVNVGAALKRLLSPRVDMAKLYAVDAHLNERLGILLSSCEDTWWALRETDNPDSLGEELYKLILNRAIPYLEKYRSAEAMLALWESGSCPGLTSGQCARFIAKLKE